MRMLQVCAVDFTAFHLLAPLLRASRDDGWIVEFACTEGPYAARLREEGFAHRRIPMTRAASPRRQLLAALALARSLRADPPDLIHTHTPAGGLAGRAAALVSFKGPVLHTFHGLPFQGSPRTLVERAFLVVERLLARRTDFFFSQATGDVDRAVVLGIARRDAIMAIGNGVDTTKFAPDRRRRSQVRAELGIPDDAFVVLTIARLVREKGVLDLADAAVQLAHEPAIHVLVAGEALPSDRTSAEAELRAHRVNVALGERWRLLGHRSDVDALLAASDVFVLPSYREGLPRSVIEAMASGVPVVASDIPACRELVRDGVSGVLVPVRDPGALAVAIADLRREPDRAARMATAARELAIAQHDERAVLLRQLEVFRRFAPPLR